MMKPTLLFAIALCFSLALVRAEEIKESWVNGKFVREGGTVYLRLNEGLKPSVGSKDFRYELFFSVYSTDTSDVDLYFKQLDDIESALKNELEKEKKAHLGLVLTGSGFRDLIFYSSDPDSAKEILSKLQKRFSNEITLKIEENDWLRYRNFTKSEKQNQALQATSASARRLS